MMRRSTSAGEIGTTPTAALLLQATFLQGKRAIDAWNEWKSRVDVSGHVGRESYRLIPQLARNLQAQGTDEPLLGRLKGIRRYTWSRNQLLIERAAPLLERLSIAGNRAILVGEAAMLLLSGSDYGLYPVDELGILVHPDERGPALEHLIASGWQSVSAVAQSVDRLLECSIFSDENGNRIRVNWCLLPEYGGTNLDEDVWKGASRTSEHGRQFRIQNPADQLLSACAHGMRAQERSFYARLADTMTLLDAFADAIDWDRLLAQAQKRCLSLAVSSVISCLQQDLGAPIPQSICNHLNARAFSRYERIEQRLAGDNVSLFHRAGRLWFRYLRLTDDYQRYQSLRYFPTYLQRRWQLQHVWQVPVHAMQLALSTMRRQI